MEPFYHDVVLSLLTYRMSYRLRQKRGKARFVSLHRKWLASLSLLLFVVSASFGALNYWYLQDQVRSQQAANQAAWEAEFRGLIELSVDRLQRLSVVLASLGKLTERINELNSVDTRNELKQRFSGVRYELDVDRVMIFDKEGKIRWNWSSDSNSLLSMQPMMDTIVRMKGSEQPEALLDCQSQCSLNVVMPLLNAGKHVGFIGLSQRITDQVVEFSKMTGVDVGLLIHTENKNEKTISRWGLYTAALTHAQSLIPLMTHLSNYYASPTAIPTSSGLPWNKEFYVFSSLPLKTLIKGTNGYLVFISNVSKATSVLKKSNQTSFLLLVVALFFAEIFLLLFLRRPLRRLEHLASTLPVVAKGGYQEAYHRLNRQQRSSGARDEIDLLYETSFDLTQQIEESQLELASDRDFIQGLLDSAQVMILTQTHAGVIHTVNRYMSQLMGRTPENLMGREFAEFLKNDAGKENYLSNREKLFTAAMPRLEHEGSIIDAKGEQRHIIWNHTVLGQTHNDDVAVLSVGLDATDRILAESRSHWLAHHDPLTGLANRLRFHEELQRSYSESVRSGITSALMLIDLDYFKTVNDTSGHAAGDTLLMQLANELRSRARKSDLVARLGGDEFAVLMPNTGQAGADAFAESLNKRLTDHKFTFGDMNYSISCSIGIALMPMHGESVEELMVNVDAAMYRAKKGGRGRHYFFTTENNTLVLE